MQPSMAPWDAAFGPRLTETSREMAAMHHALGELLSVDQNGRVNAIPERVERALTSFTQENTALSVLREHIGVMLRDGAAMVPGGDDGMLKPLPWATIDYLTPRRPDIALSVLLGQELGAEVVRPRELGEILRQTYPNVPDRLLTPPRLSAMMPRRDSYGSDNLPGPGNGGGGVPKPAPEGPGIWGFFEPVADLVDCFVNADWSIHFWGFSVCMDRDCALKVAEALRWSAWVFAPGPGGSMPGAWLALFLKLGKVAILALALIWLYAVVLSFNIRWVVNQRGACIGASWPTPLLGTYVFAYPR